MATPPSPDTLRDLNKRKTYIEDWLKSKNVVDVPLVYDMICRDDRAAKRAIAVMKGDVTSKSNPRFTQQFKKFCGFVPVWSSLLDQLHRLESLGHCVNTECCEDLSLSDLISAAADTSIVAFWEQIEDFPAVKPGFQVNHCLILREQLSGNCYLHAAVALEHYMVCLGTQCEDLNMIDMGLYARGLAGVDNQATVIDFLTKVGGGNSAQHVKSICNLMRADLHNLHTAAHADRIYEVVKQKPLLVHGFEVYPALYEENKFSYGVADIEEAQRGESVPAHSMIMIGARKTEDEGEGGYYYLLQNWWSGKYFVEVSASYLQHCLMYGGVVYIVPALTARNPKHPTLLTEYAESGLEWEEDLEDEW